MKVLLLCLNLTTAIGNAAGETPLPDLLMGNYEVIGRKPDSQQTYSGKITLRNDEGILKMVREIGGQTSEGSVVFKTAAASEKSTVMSVRFESGGSTYEATYQWQSDPDRHFRLTGRIHRADGSTASPGIEAIFPLKP